MHMTTIVISSISVILALLLATLYAYALRYYLHMFQLNGYKPAEQRTWLRRNRERHRLLLLLGALCLISLCCRSLPYSHAGLAPILLIAAAGIAYYAYQKKTNTKKKLVATWRVRRLTITSVLLLLLPLGFVTCLLLRRETPEVAGILSLMVYVMGLLIAATPCLLLLANLLNRPVEARIRQGFIRDAKRMLREHPHLTIIGVTGSYGKTSVKYYLDMLLRTRYQVLITPESYNTPMGVVKTIREGLKNTHEIFVCEMGARHIGDIKELCDLVHPQHGIITAVGPQHLETFYSIENIQKTKFELADALPSDGMLFVNMDNDYARAYAGHYTGVTGYGTDPGAVSPAAGYRGFDIRVSQLGTDFKVKAPDGSVESYQMQLIGEHNVVNVVGAIAVAHRLGIPLAELRVPVRRLRPVAHRMQLLERGGGVTLIDDAYNSNPVGSRAAVETLKLFDGVRILLTPGMVELGTEEDRYNYAFGSYAAACCDYILLIGSRHTAPIAKGAIDAGYDESRIRVFERIEDALHYAYGITDEGHKYLLLENDLPDNYS